MHSFYEFFAGGGMARAGLGEEWRCAFANDFDHKKGAAYTENWGGGELKVGDIRQVSATDLPGQASLAWASFPCQDLSLAGGGAGLRGERSGTFWPFWTIVSKLNASERAPSLVVLENVCGTLASHGGQDFVAIADAFVSQGYQFGAVVVDAELFVPHSRQRLFVIGVKSGIDIPSELVADGPQTKFHTKQLIDAKAKLSETAASKWIWWKIPTPAKRTTNFVDLLEEPVDPGAWHSAEETNRLLEMMSPINLAKVQEAKRAGRRMVGCVYKRTRHTADKKKVQRAEIRFDDVSGCLRTPAGGSSRQVIVIVDGNRVRSRLITARETARLMGLPESYILPQNYNDAYHLTGDGVAVPVVRHLARHILGPIVNSLGAKRAKTAERTKEAA